jgi:hypothetical protein
MRKQLLSSTVLRAVQEALVAAGAPAEKATEVAVTLVSSFEPKHPPAQIESPDMTPKEVGAYRRESASTVQRKMRLGVYRSYLSGPDKRLITRESVLADRETCLAAGPQFPARAEVVADRQEVQ